jgi:Flp pilus assembly protein TadD
LIADHFQQHAVIPDIALFQRQVTDYFRSGQFLELAAAAREIIKQQPSSGLAWKALGAALWALGEKDAALTAKREASRLSPNDPEAHGNLANSLQSMGRFSEALIALQRT